jgi:hypothetical protein
MLELLKIIKTSLCVLKKEEELIFQYKAIGQCQCNCVFGGCGGVKTYWTKEMREKMSKDNPMKSPIQKSRMSKENSMKNPKIANIVGNKHKKPCCVGDKSFDSVKEAAEFYNRSATTVGGWIKKGLNPEGEVCFYVKKTNPISYKKEKCYIIFKGKKYNSIMELSEKENIKYRTVQNWLKKGFSSSGEYIRYSNDNKEYVYIKPNKTHNNKVIQVNDVVYNSIKEASKDLNINCTTLRSLLNGKNSYKYKHLNCKYVNQQPSTSLNGL